MNYIGSVKQHRFKTIYIVLTLFFFVNINYYYKYKHTFILIIYCILSLPNTILQKRKDQSEDGLRSMNITLVVISNNSTISCNFI